MDAEQKKYLILAVVVLVVLYAVAHVDTLREKVLGLPALA